jgi:RNA polymerase subunit RPABC4/transcription elongation factor Spt4
MPDRSVLPNVNMMTVQGPRGPDQKHCFSCGNIIHVSANQCPHCGATQPSQMRSDSTVLGLPHIVAQVFCRGCGASIHADAAACPRCGAPQAARVVGSKSKIVAALLAFLVGGLGIHKFYLGEIAWGVVYILFCWTFIPAFVALIEGIAYLCTSDQTFARKYG